ncbi:MAG: glycoside hydrolase family 2 protein [Oscillospiraceae bacterium]|nr:glycoside hydrolase family 2 protein [Oscillospiraceae bacterium]
MRNIRLFNEHWHFTKDNSGVPAAVSGEAVTLPHTWNAIDGQDGKNDYYRGTCWYTKELEVVCGADEEVWLEFRGAAYTADVYVNGEKLAHHEGGYSTFRVNVTAYAGQKALLAVSVNNGANRTVYPQKADFTFYGGLYRNVWLVTVPKTHFELAYLGTPAIKVTPIVSDDYKTATVTVDTWQNADVPVTITAAGQTQTVASVDGHAVAEFVIENVHLWDGKNDPYLYTAEAALESGDVVSTQFGCRKYEVNAQKGFILNGKPYPLCGVARHQDRQGLGNALTTKEHDEDLALILELGANTIRLAHYQHDQYFYDICDKAGIICWAEIPYITEHMPEGRENTFSQMRELITQCYNHPCIICWGLSNEITAHGGKNDDCVDNHVALNALVHELDKTRPTTMAHVFMLEMEDPFVMLPDIRSFNLYFGWYVGDCDQNDEWFDNFHRQFPDAAIGLSEYGADANPAYQSANPEKGDWTESYQAVYHEHMLKMWQERPYIWAMHCWNMFDFGADGRNEGGKPGQNQKGLVTFDRKLKKDAFYIYKAYLSKEPFVHLCGSRYANRHEKVTEIKVYSNQSSVTLYMDGKEIGTLESDKVFMWNVEMTGEHTFTAVSGELKDTMTIRKVAEKDMSYYKDPEQVVNWFDKDDVNQPVGYFSIYNTMGEVMANPEAAAVMAPMMERAMSMTGDVAKGIKLPQYMIDAQMRMTIEATLKQFGKLISKEEIMEVNKQLNQVKIS